MNLSVCGESFPKLLDWNIVFIIADVDTHEPDEKSLITYISSLYETFPEPPAVHPLFDAESQRRAAAYTELAAQHRAWLAENTQLMQVRAN